MPSKLAAACSRSAPQVILDAGQFLDQLDNSLLGQ